MIEFNGGDGSSLEKAIIIKGASNSIDGVRAEYDYIIQRFGKRGKTWNLHSQELIVQESHYVDKIIITHQKDMISQTFYFNITAFFGTGSFH